MELIIDSRENKIKELFNVDSNTTINYKIEHLDVGDFIIRNNNEDILIIERKTLGDLYGSIQDGRYKEQKSRLLAGYPLHKIIYLIEGSVKEYNKKFFKNFKSIVNGAIINTMFRDNFRILRTCTINESYDSILSLYNKIQKKPEYFKTIDKIDNSGDNSVDDVPIKTNEIENTTDIMKDYLYCIKIKKKDNMTPKMCNILQLSQIPGVSKNMSVSIIDKYGSISKLVLEYLKLEIENDKKTMLKNLLYNSSSDVIIKTRKIGPVVSGRIYDYLFL